MPNFEMTLSSETSNDSGTIASSKAEEGFDLDFRVTYAKVPSKGPGPDYGGCGGGGPVTTDCTAFLWC